MNKSELQKMLAILQQELTIHYKVISDCIKTRKEIWEKCDPDKPETEKHFKDLNFFNVMIARLKKDVAIKAKLSRKLKQEIRG